MDGEPFRERIMYVAVLDTTEYIAAIHWLVIGSWREARSTNILYLFHVRACLLFILSTAC